MFNKPRPALNPAAEPVTAGAGAGAGNDIIVAIMLPLTPPAWVVDVESPCDERVGTTTVPVTV